MAANRVRAAESTTAAPASGLRFADIALDDHRLAAAEHRQRGDESVEVLRRHRLERLLPAQPDQAVLDEIRRTLDIAA